VENGKFVYDKVKRHLKRIDITRMNEILIPINIGNYHWVGVVISMSEKRISYYDSLLSSRAKGMDYLRIVREWVVNEHGQKKLQIEENKWELVIETVPEQKNSYDCGIFMLTFFFCRMHDICCNSFTQANITCLRKIIALELKRTKLITVAPATEGLIHDMEV
jgi:Ulp1 family protease